jgi:hypothetical protein
LAECCANHSCGHNDVAVSILHSYRWRRRLAFTAIALGVAGPLIWLGVRYSQPGKAFNANGPTVPDYVQAKHAAFTPAKQRAVHRVLKEFIATAVVRHDVAKAWAIAGPTLKEGVSRQQWDRGDLPVIPYPALNKGWGNWSFVQYSYTDSVGLEVFLFPKPHSGWSAMTADVELVKGKDGRWLVDYWMPKKFHGPPATAHVTKAKTKAKTLRERHATKAKKPAPPEAAATDATRARGAWWALPLGLLGLAVFLPLTIGGIVWYRNRKAERAYLRSVTNGNPGSHT